MTTKAKRDRSTLLDQARAYIEKINLGGFRLNSDLKVKGAKPCNF